MFHNTMQDYRHERGYRAGRGGWVVKFSHIKKFKLTRGCCSPLTTLPVLPPQWQVSFNLLPNNPMAPPQCEGSFGPSAAPGHQWFPHNDSLWTEPSQLFRFHALCSWSIPMVSSKVTYMWHLSGPFWVTTCLEKEIFCTKGVAHWGSYESTVWFVQGPNRAFLGPKGLKRVRIIDQIIHFVRFSRPVKFSFGGKLTLRGMFLRVYIF